jgi:phosphatidylserine decarboxylase
MSVKEGRKFDSPDSAKGIATFIEFYNLNVDEMLLAPDQYKTFNEFFYRKLKPDARPVADPNDPTTIVSGADCRLMAFQTVNDATRIWVKGREFTVARLLGEKYKDEAHNYDGGALVIFRLAPQVRNVRSSSKRVLTSLVLQDYHRFHSPVDGKIGPMTYISGNYYTVNPQAIRTQLDVYGENARKIVPIDTPTFGRVFCACIGAMMVGTIVTTLNEGDSVKRGQEFGYFAFGRLPAR